ncbi:MAG: S8 family serine peptidase [FCB group bacterium]|nr:S8 family serine peptidase [FCB group bacterium]
MKRLYFMLGWLGMIWLAYGNQPVSGQLHAWVFFTDKPAASSPVVHLSPRTIERRQRQGLPVNGWLDRRPSTDYENALQSLGLTVRQRSRWLNAVSVAGTRDQLDAAASLPFVLRTQPVRITRHPREDFQPVTIPPTRLNRDSRVLDYGYATEQIEQIRINRLHDLGFNGAGVRVLVMDTGFNLTHPAFDSLNVIAQWDVINDDSVCANETAEETNAGQHNHGTVVLSAMAGYKPGELIGPAYGAEFLLAKTEIVDQEIELEEDNYVAGLEWGEARGADVVSTSLGYLDWYTYCDMDGNTAVTTNAIDQAVSLGLVCVTAMGNEGGYSPPVNPCQDALTYYMIAPADADSVISVGAVDSKGSAAYFTSHGPTYDGRIKPEVCARGLLTAAVNPNTDGYIYSNGTSLSTPLIGGATAVLVGARPDWTPMQIREALMNTASQADQPDNTLGYGVANYWDAYQYAFVGVDDEQSVFPESFSSISTWPNPFNGEFVISLRIEKPTTGSLSIVNMQGRTLETIASGSFAAGTLTYHVKALQGPSGVYFVMLKTGDQVRTHKLIYLK